MKPHQKVYKIASILLDYPDQEWLKHLPEIQKEVNLMNHATVQAYMTPFLYYLDATPFDELCERYVKTFDYHGVVSLNLTYNVFKDSRRRGEALIKLRQIFNESDLVLQTDELPDYLPLILEFLSVANEKNVHYLLKLHLNSIKQLEKDLSKNDSEYHFLIKSVVEVSTDLIRDLKVS